MVVWTYNGDAEWVLEDVACGYLDTQEVDEEEVFNHTVYSDVPECHGRDVSSDVSVNLKRGEIRPMNEIRESLACTRVTKWDALVQGHP